MSVLCWLSGIWSSLRTLSRVSGCSYREIECKDPNLDVLRCQRCGRCLVSWRYHRPKNWDATKRLLSDL